MHEVAPIDFSKTFRYRLRFWGILILGFTLIQFLKEGNAQSLYTIFFQNARRLPAMMLVAHTFNDVLLPQFYTKRRYLPFILLSIILFYVGGVLDRVINVYVYEPMFRERPFPQESLLEIFTDWPFLVSAYLPALLTATLIMSLNKLIAQKNSIQRRNVQLERDKNIAELNLLKAQLHPHFLFNTLNNLYALTIKKSDKAPEVVATLSEMLDYILYQCNDTWVSLDKEINLLDNYITLEKLRYGDEIDISFSKTQSKPVQIAPLLLLSIVENAFKHGASGSLDRLQIEIDLVQEGDTLNFSVKNTKNTHAQKDATQYTKGIGVSNIKQQMELLYSDYSYEVTDENGWYCVALRINTAQDID